MSFIHSFNTAVREHSFFIQTFTNQIRDSLRFTEPIYPIALYCRPVDYFNKTFSLKHTM